MRDFQKKNKNNNAWYFIFRWPYSSIWQQTTNLFDLWFLNYTVSCENDANLLKHSMGVLSDASVGAKNLVVDHGQHQHRLEVEIMVSFLNVGWAFVLILKSINNLILSLFFMFCNCQRDGPRHFNRYHHLDCFCHWQLTPH